MLKKLLSILIGIIFIVSYAFFASAQEIEMKEGLWEITTKMDIPGENIPSMSYTYTLCLTKKNMIPYEDMQDKDENGFKPNCKLIEYKIKGNTILWKIKCKDKKGVSITTGKTTYTGDTFEGIVKVKTASREMTMYQKGKWIGSCE